MSEDDGYVYGREVVIRRIVNSEAKAIVVTGDSGVGKSTVLSGAQRISVGLAPTPVPVGAGPGALGRALSAAVTLALAAHVDDEGQIPLLRERMLAASRRLRRRAGHRVREDLVVLLLDQVRMRIGETAAEMIAETRSAWNESEQDSLQTRLAALTETDAALALAEVGRVPLPGAGPTPSRQRRQAAAGAPVAQRMPLAWHRLSDADGGLHGLPGSSVACAWDRPLVGRPAAPAAYVPVQGRGRVEVGPGHGSTLLAADGASTCTPADKRLGNSPRRQPDALFCHEPR